CPVNTNPTTDGDRIGDTDPHKASDGCSTYLPTSLNPCTGIAFGTLLQNMMSYSACKTRFTLNQVERMRYALLFSRTGLINSYGKIPPVAGETSPTAACVVSAPNGASAYFGINTFTLNTIALAGGGSAAQNGSNYSDKTCLVQTTLQTGTPYSFSLSSLYGNSVNAKIYIDYTNNGSFLDANEQVFSSLSFSNAFTGTITVPNGTPTNIKLRMRVVLDISSLLTACLLPGLSPYGSGIAEDYGITITSGVAPCIAMTTLRNGNWDDPTVWSCNRVPTSSDIVEIGHLLVVPGNAVASAKQIRYTNGGRISQSLTAKLRLGF
ncbi:MAG: GEVED domain-containing protein, partial [Rudanella sp.]|nr:GEVED domain-containing protein [Rudanella sp.]